MNLGRLHDVFRIYIGNFDYNNKETGHHEVYKWYKIKEFRDTFNLNTPVSDFAEMLTNSKKITGNITDSGQQMPMAALCEYAKLEPEILKTILTNLLSPDSGDLSVRQSKIEDFIDSTNKLLEQYFPGSYKFKMSQYTTMTFMWMYDPDIYYRCQPTPAKALAKYIGFDNDWGVNGDFDLNLYYEFCDEIIHEIKCSKRLTEIHASHFEKDKSLMHPDKEFHILLADIMFCYYRYHIEGKINSSEITKTELAYKYWMDYSEAKQTLDTYEEAISAFLTLINDGKTLRHNTFGIAELKNFHDGFCDLYFPEKNKKLSRPFLKTIGAGYLIIDSPEFDNLVSKYKSILSKDKAEIIRTVERTNNRFAPYEKYID